VNQVRNRQRWWRRRHRSELISLEQHLRHTDVEARETIWPDRQLARRRRPICGARSSAFRSTSAPRSSCARWTAWPTTRSRTRWTSPWAR
jgi:hypothetical protein